MISKEEILTQALKQRLLPTTIEKDYVLGWVLAGIAEHEKLSQCLVFKGGTCLKKCFFGKGYRYSEDLDFTLAASERAIQTSELEKWFKEMSLWVFDASQIALPGALLQFEKYSNTRGTMGIQGRLRYRGPLQQKTNIPKIKIDVTLEEAIMCKPQPQTILHDYTDVLEGDARINTYCFEEVFAEKLRALFQRLKPRDLYDAISIYNQKRSMLDCDIVQKVLKQKCKNAGVEINCIDNHPFLETAKASWQQMLSHQIADLHPIEHYLDQVPELMLWITEKAQV